MLCYPTMNMPDSVEVLGFPVSIQYSDEMSEDILGLCKPETGQIFVRKDMTEKEVWAVLYHELGHYIWYRMSANRKVTEEQFCKMLESIATLSFGGMV